MDRTVKLGLLAACAAGAASAWCAPNPPPKKAVVCVMDFDSREGCEISPGGLKILHDRIISNVVSSRKYEVVERHELAKVQSELKLVDAGLTEGDAPESNRLKAAGYCIAGTVIQYRNYATAGSLPDDSLRIQLHNGIVELKLKITDIANGHIRADKIVKRECRKRSAQYSNVSTTKDLRLEVLTQALDEAAKEVVGILNEVAFPVYVLSANSRFVTGNVTAEQVTVGELWEVFELGDEMIDPSTGESLGQDEDLVCRVRVSRPKPKTTQFEALSPADLKKIQEVLEAKGKMVMRRVVKGADVEKPKPSLRRMF